jgi:hypothetical protein
MVELIWVEADDQQERISRRVVDLVRREADRTGRADNDRLGRQKPGPLSSNPAPDTVRQFLQAFSSSPIGVMKAFTVACKDKTSYGARPDAVLLTVERLLLELPEEFQRFWSLSGTERVDLILGF